MNAQARRSLLGASIAASALALASCGGGGDDACTNVDFCPAVSTAAATATGTPAAATPAAPVFQLAPASLALSNCTTGVPFIFTGGRPPYTVLTSNNFNVPVSAALPLDATRSYFLADTHYPPVPPGDEKEHKTTLTVQDSDAQTVVASVTTTVTPDACPTNPKFQASPESANFRTSETRAFSLTGGSGAAPTVTFLDAGVAQVVSVNPSTVTVQAVATVRATTLMTIASTDGQRTNVVINVLPQP